MDRLVCRFVVLLSLVVSLTRSSPIRGIITPSTPSAFVGRTVTLNCTLQGSITNDNSARHIYFNFTNPYVKSKAVTDVINDRTARLTISGVNLTMSSSKISCHLRNYTLNEVTIVIDKPPFQNSTINCIVYNWESMTCTWEMDDTENINVSMAYSRSGCKSNSRYRCPSPIQERGNGSCTLQQHDNSNSFFFMDHCVWLMARNAQNVIAWSRGTTIVVITIVQPNMVTAFKTLKVAIDHITLNWTSPNALKTIRFRVAYESRFSNISIRNTTETSITLSNLIPNTEYTITIDCIPLVRGNATGFWSDKVYLNATTRPDLPGDSPSLTSGGFVVIERNDTHRKIKLFFQPVDDNLSHGEVKGYRVRYSIGNSTNEFEKPDLTTNVILSLEIQEMYTVSIEMQNVLGYNGSLEPKTIVIGRQSELPVFPENFVVQTDGQGTYILNWTLVDENSSYTLYWCISKIITQFDCSTNPLNWKILPPNQTSEVLQVVAPSDLTVHFAISVEKVTPSGETVSSGMLTSSCTYLTSGDLKPPANVKLLQRTADTVTVELPRLEKCDRTKAYPLHYLITYCAVKQCKATDKMWNVTVESFRQSVKIEGLVASEEYKVWIQSLSENGNSSDAALIGEVTTFEDKQTGEEAFPVGVVVVVVVIFAASCAVPGIVKLIYWWKKHWHIDVKPPPKYLGDNLARTPDTAGYSTFLRSELDSSGQVQTTLWESDHKSHGYFNTAAFQPGEDENLLSRHNSEYKSSTSSSEMSAMPSTQSSSSSSKSSDPRRDSGISNNSISGYNVVIEQPSETSGSSGRFHGDVPCDENAIATTEIC